MVGIAIIALPSGIVTAGYIDELRSRKDAKKAKKAKRGKEANEANNVMP
jgi:voltage-gated potassium channel